MAGFVQMYVTLISLLDILAIFTKSRSHPQEEPQFYPEVTYHMFVFIVHHESYSCVLRHIQNQFIQTSALWHTPLLKCILAIVPQHHL